MSIRLVVVPYETLMFSEKEVVLPCGAKEKLKFLPVCKYTAE